MLPESSIIMPVPTSNDVARVRGGHPSLGYYGEQKSFAGAALETI